MPGISAALRKRKQKPRKNKERNPWEKPRKKTVKKDDDSDGVESQTEEDYSDTNEERKEEYRKGGYHPVAQGELYNSRYRTAHKLGWGYFSTVWLVWDYVDKDFKAMKVQKGAQHYREAAFDEIKLLDQIMKGDPKLEKCCCAMTDSFEHKGPNGKHVVMVFRVLGENLLSLITKYDYKGTPLRLIRPIAKQILIGLDYLHRELQIIHTDLKPENVLLRTPVKKIRRIMDRYVVPPIDKQLLLTEKDPSMLSKAQKKRLKKKLRAGKKDGDDKDSDEEDEQSAERPAGPPVSAKPQAIPDEDISDEDEEYEEERRKNVVLADFGNGCWTYKQFTDEIQTRQYRSPEVILGEPYSTPVDVWSCACLIFELLTGEFLFDPRTSDNFDRDEDHLALIVELLGPLPPRMSRGHGKYREKYLNKHGELRHITSLKYWGLSSVLHHKYKFTKQKADEIADFLLPMLHADPEQRATAEEMLVNYADWFEVKPGDDTPYVDQNPPEPGSDEEEEELEETDQSLTRESDSFPDESGEDGQYGAPARAHSI